jgi:hypothetical protein
MATDSKRCFLRGSLVVHIHTAERPRKKAPGRIGVGAHEPLRTFERLPRTMVCGFPHGQLAGVISLLDRDAELALKGAVRIATKLGAKATSNVSLQ